MEQQRVVAAICCYVQPNSAVFVFRVGMNKKGKAAKQALQLFLNSSSASPAEKELLKLVPDQDVINVLVSQLKLTAPAEGKGKIAKATKRKPKEVTLDD